MLQFHGHIWHLIKGHFSAFNVFLGLMVFPRFVFLCFIHNLWRTWLLILMLAFLHAKISLISHTSVGMYKQTIIIILSYLPSWRSLLVFPMILSLRCVWLCPSSCLLSRICHLVMLEKTRDLAREPRCWIDFKIIFNVKGNKILKESFKVWTLRIRGKKLRYFLRYDPKHKVKILWRKKSYLRSFP